MKAKQISAANIRLDDQGRAVLDDDLLDAIAQHDLSFSLAGGSNAACANSGCSNSGCDSPIQTNTGCTNTGCGGNLNTKCNNQREIEG